MTYNLKSISQDSVSWYPQQKQSLSNRSLLQKEKGTQKRSLNHMYNLPFTYFRLLERFNVLLLMGRDLMGFLGGF